MEKIEINKNVDERDNIWKVTEKMQEDMLFIKNQVENFCDKYDMAITITTNRYNGADFLADIEIDL